MVQLVRAVLGPHVVGVPAQISNKVFSSMKPWILKLQHNQCNSDMDTASSGQSTLKVPPGGQGSASKGLVWEGKP